MLRGSLTPGGEVDYSSLHGSCPTTKGEKWSATKWIHVSTFGGNTEAAKAKWCVCCGWPTFACSRMLPVRWEARTFTLLSCGHFLLCSGPLGMQGRGLLVLACHAADRASTVTKCMCGQSHQQEFCIRDEQGDQPRGAGGTALMATRAAPRGRRRASAPPTLASCSPAAGSAAIRASQGIQRHTLQHNKCREGRRVHLAMYANSAVLAGLVRCSYSFLAG